MSSQPSAAPKKPVRSQNEGPNSELMRALGSKGYTAMPPDQHAWQRAEAEHNPPLHRLWSWMVHHILTWRHTTVDGVAKAYATSSDGTELHLDHAAKDLKMDLPNVYRTWKQGVALGLWRNGTKEEGKRKLILCGSVVAPEEVSEDPEIVCTDNFDPCLRKLPGKMRDQILSKPAEEVKLISTWYSRHLEVEKAAAADAMAAVRFVVGRIEDEGWRRFSVEKARLLDRKTDAAAEEIAARQARLNSLLPQVEQLVFAVAADVAEASQPGDEAKLRAELDRTTVAPPRAKLSVQTKNDSVQNAEVALYKENSEAVQGVSGGPTLLPVPTTKRGKRAGGISLSKPMPKSGRSRSNEGEASVQLHAGDPTTHVLQTLTHEEKAEADRVLLRTQALQKLYPKRWTGELLDPENKGDQVWSVLVVRALALREVDLFMGAHLEKRLLANALGNRVGLGLVLEWARDFASRAGEREQQRQAEADQETKRLAFVEAMEARHKREDVILEQVEAAWDALPVGERVDRLRKTEQALHADPHWDSVLRHNETERRHQSELRAKRQLRSELEKSGGLR